MAHHDNPAHYGIRTRDHKLIYFYGLPLDAKGAHKESTEAHWELYDLSKDPHEMNNLYQDPQYKQVVEELKHQLLAVKDEIGDRDEKYPELMKLRAATW
jgi:N-acetylglucosamine-6-sulfatase